MYMYYMNETIWRYKKFQTISVITEIFIQLFIE